LKRIQDLRGEKAKVRQEKQVASAMEKAKQTKLPKNIKAPTGDYIPRRQKKRAHTSTLLKKGISIK
jgi:hypothetical protein